MTAMVADYYAGKNVLITGGTGFMGKVLVEKLLRSCPRVKALYLLVRPKASQSVEQRLGDMVKCKVRGRAHKRRRAFCNAQVLRQGARTHSSRKHKHHTNRLDEGQVGGGGGEGCRRDVGQC